MANDKNKKKKAILKGIIKGKNGASPIKMDNGLGKTPLTDKTAGSGNGSNLGINGVF